MKKPDFLKEEHLEYLDNLRQSGITNMFGAQPYLCGAFPELNEKQGGEILSYWMKIFPRTKEE